MKFSLYSLLTFVFLISVSACNKFTDKHDKDDCCFTLVYPVSYTMPDDVIVTGEDEESVNAAQKEWYLANADSKEKPTLNYPVDIVSKKLDTAVTFENEDEFAAWKKDNCKWKGDKDEEDGDK